jgi:NAD(P)-dependent dehydrogenase (short-subunit alcohol dehydrogenase family)
LASAGDAALEATVIGGFSRVGYVARRRLFNWPPGQVDLSGRFVVLTGATSGIGREAALEMAAVGAELVVVGRDEQRLARIVADAREVSPVGARVHGVRADLSLLSEARRLVSVVAELTSVVDVLVHNAGAMTHDYTVTPEGFEVTFASQVLAPYVITSGLLEELRAAADPRVIVVSSGGMYAERLDPDTVQFGPADYDGVRSYARAKRAQVALSAEWARRFPEIGFHAMHPGWVDTPGVATALPGFRRLTAPVLRTPAEGADTIVWLAGSSSREVPGGRFWLDRRARSTVRLPWTRPASGAAADLWHRVGVLTDEDPR